MELKQLFKKFAGRTPALLIVPYGIETKVVLHLHHTLHSFNRTLWN